MGIHDKSLNELSSLLDELERVDSIQGRIQFLVDCVGNPNSFAKKVGMSVSGLKRYLNGGEPTASKLVQMASSMGINPAWLLTGKGFIVEGSSNERAITIMTERQDFTDALDSVGAEGVANLGNIYSTLKLALSHCSELTQEIVATSVSKTSKEYSKDSIELVMKELTGELKEEFALIPGYSIQVSAGHGSLNLEQLEPSRHLAFRRKWLTFRGFKEKDLVIVWSKGDSMEPTINNNDTLVVHTGRTKPQDGNIYIFRREDELFVKRYQSTVDAWRLISDNAMYTPLDIKKEEQH